VGVRSLPHHESRTVSFARSILSTAHLPFYLGTCTHRPLYGSPRVELTYFSPLLFRNLINMFTQLFAIIAIVAAVRADPIPATPPSGQKVGGQCTIQWAADPTGIWKAMHIELMAGPNLNMQHLTSMFLRT
jgi:hypothetical protein